MACLLPVYHVVLPAVRVLPGCERGISKVEGEHEAREIGTGGEGESVPGVEFIYRPAGVRAIDIARRSSKTYAPLRE